MEKPDEVTLAVPSDPAYLPIVRVAAAVAADRAGLSHLDIEDLRLALDELVHHVLGDREGRLALTVTHHQGEVTVDAQRTGRSTVDAPALSTVLDDVVSAAVDGWTLHDHGPGSFHLVKRRSMSV